MRCLLMALAAGVLVASGAQAQPANAPVPSAFPSIPPAHPPYKVPRNAFGQPDLEGYWTSVALTVLERPSFFKDLVPTEEKVKEFESRGPTWTEGGLFLPPAGKAKPVAKADISVFGGTLDSGTAVARINGQPRSSWVVDPPNGQVPWRPEAFKFYRSELNRLRNWYDNPESGRAAERCIIGYGSVGNPPLLNTIYNGNYKIQQSKDALVLVVEMNHDARIIRLNVTKHLDKSETPWLGDTIGHWEGDTLVAETTNFNPDESMRTSFGHYLMISKNAKVTERFTRISPSQILYEYEVDDPTLFSQKWKGQMPLNTAKGRIFEYACHEGNYSMAGMMAGARKVEAEGGTPEAAVGLVGAPPRN